MLFKCYDETLSNLIKKKHQMEGEDKQQKERTHVQARKHKLVDVNIQRPQWREGETSLQGTYIDKVFLLSKPPQS